MSNMKNLMEKLAEIREELETLNFELEHTSREDWRKELSSKYESTLKEWTEVSGQLRQLGIC